MICPANADLFRAGKSGRGELRVEFVAGQSAVVTARAGSPLKILVPRPRGPSVSACFSSYGGGLVAGDEIEVDLELGEQARCHLSTQASTKIYRNPGRLGCGHVLKAALGRAAVLVLAPDPVQAFAGSLYRQHQEFHLQNDSGLVLLDWLSSGRTECGERWAFSRYESRNEIVVAGRRLALDSLLLDPADGAIGGSYRMGRFNCLALLALVGGVLEKPAAQLLESIARRPISRRGSLTCCASPLSGGALVRIAGERAEEVRHEVYRLLDFLPEVLHDDPRLRKW
jgi:urease accessory protein